MLVVAASGPSGSSTTVTVNNALVPSAPLRLTNSATVTIVTNANGSVQFNATSGSGTITNVGFASDWLQVTGSPLTGGGGTITANMPYAPANSNHVVTISNNLNGAIASGNTTSNTLAGFLYHGNGDPNGVVAAGTGAVYRQDDAATAATALWIKFGAGNTGWFQVPPSMATNLFVFQNGTFSNILAAAGTINTDHLKSAATNSTASFLGSTNPTVASGTLTGPGGQWSVNNVGAATFNSTVVMGGISAGGGSVSAGSFTSSTVYNSLYTDLTYSATNSASSNYNVLLWPQNVDSCTFIVDRNILILGTNWPGTNICKTATLTLKMDGTGGYDVRLLATNLWTTNGVNTSGVISIKSTITTSANGETELMSISSRRTNNSGKLGNINYQ